MATSDEHCTCSYIDKKGRVCVCMVKTGWPEVCRGCRAGRHCLDEQTDTVIKARAIVIEPNDVEATEPQPDERWEGRVYQDMDPREIRENGTIRTVTVQSPPSGPRRHVQVVSSKGRKSYIEEHTILSRKFSRRRDLEDTRNAT